MTDTASVKEKQKMNPKVQKDIIKCVVVLVAIAVISGALLGALNYVTYVDPETVIKGLISEEFGVAIEDIQKTDASLLVQGNTKNGKVSNCYYTEKDGVTTYYYQSTGFGCKGGSMELLVVVKGDGAILDILEIKSNETAGYFKKVDKALKSAYQSKNIKNIDTFELIKSDKEPTKDNQIPGVSSATFTSKGYNHAVSAAAYDFQHRLGGGVNEK